jgi:hypothetical protein
LSKGRIFFYNFARAIDKFGMNIEFGDGIWPSESVFEFILFLNFLKKNAILRF